MSTSLKRVRRKRRRKTALTRPEQVRRLLILGLVVVVGFFIGLFGFASVHKGWNRWREARLLRQAAIFLQNNDAAAAEETGRKVIALDPGSAEACSILAEATELQNRPDTVAWRAQVARLAPSLDSQLNLASAALRFSQLDLARNALGKVAPGDVDKAAYHVVAGWLARAQGNHAEEERHFAAAVAQEPKNDVYQFNLAVLRILSPDPEKSAAARNELERLSKIAQFRTPALRALLENAVRQNQMPAAETLAQDLQMSQEVSFSDYLLCLDLYRKLNEKKFAALLNKVKPVALRDADNLAQLLDWMDENGLQKEALKWSDKLSANLTSQPPAAISIARALAETHNFSRLKRWTRSGAWGDDEYLRLAYQAYAARESRHATADAESDALWTSAVEEAADHPERETALARLAMKWQLAQEAEQLWLRVAKSPPHRREALEALAAIYRKNNDLANLRDIAQRLHESSPDETSLGANAARLALLLDRNTAAGQLLAQQVYEKSPNDTAATVTYAFALYGNGRTQDAIALLKKLPPDRLRDPHAAVYVALILDDDNQIAAADEYIKLAKAGKLFPEEKRLLEDITARRQSVTPTPSPSPATSASPAASASPPASASPAASASPPAF